MKLSQYKTIAEELNGDYEERKANHFLKLANLILDKYYFKHNIKLEASPLLLGHTLEVYKELSTNKYIHTVFYHKHVGFVTILDCGIICNFVEVSKLSKASSDLTIYYTPFEVTNNNGFGNIQNVYGNLCSYQKVGTTLKNILSDTIFISNNW
jgi:hypothetical protein